MGAIVRGYLGAACQTLRRRRMHAGWCPVVDEFVTPSAPERAEESVMMTDEEWADRKARIECQAGVPVCLLKRLGEDAHLVVARFSCEACKDTHTRSMTIRGEDNPVWAKIGHALQMAVENVRDACPEPWPPPAFRIDE